MKIIYQMTSRVPHFIQQSQLEPQQAWKTYWFPPFRTLQKHSSNPCRQIRSQALDSLRGVMLSPSLAATSSGVLGSKSRTDLSTADASTIFNDILLPLIAQLLKPEVWHTDPAGMGDTRLQAALLTSKVYLRFLDTLLAAPLPTPNTSSSSKPSSSAPSPANGVKGSTKNASSTPSEPATSESSPGELDYDAKTPPGVIIFHRMLELLERLLRSGAPPSSVPTTSPGSSSNGTNSAAAAHEALEEAVPESVKNVLLVMAAGGYLERPGSSVRSTKEDDDDVSRWKATLWKGTEARLERFLPGLLGEVFPPPSPSQKKRQPGTAMPEETPEKNGEPANASEEVDEGGGGTSDVEK